MPVHCLLEQIQRGKRYSAVRTCTSYQPQTKGQLTTAFFCQIIIKTELKVHGWLEVHYVCALTFSKCDVEDSVPGTIYQVNGEKNEIQEI